MRVGMRVWGGGRSSVSVRAIYSYLVLRFSYRPCVWRVCVYMCVCVDGITLKRPSLVSRERGKVQGKFENQIKRGGGGWVGYVDK